MLTNEQLLILKTDMLTHPELDSARQSGDDVFLANYYNAPATPTFVVWKTLVTQDEIMQNGFDWVQVDNLTVGAARIWEWLFANSERAINPTKLNVRAGIDECWKGTAAKLAVRDQIYLHLKRNASVLEKLFATGIGTTLSPGNLIVEGQISYSEISLAR